MMPMGIERCGFLASSPVQRQEAASVPAPWHNTGQLALWMSHSRDFPWQHGGWQQQTGNVGEEGSPALLLHWQKLWHC